MIVNPISFGSGGGMHPEIIVHAPTGSTVKLDGVTGTEVSGVWTFNTTLGSHTVTATKGSDSKTVTVVVDEVAQFEVRISFRLPSGYTEVEYIQSSGTQHIQTNLTADGSTRFKCKFYAEQLASPEDSVSATLFGSRTSYLSRKFQLATYMGGSFGLGSSLMYEKYKNLFSLQTITTVEFRTDSYLYVDDTQKDSVSAESFTCPSVMYIFAMYSGGSITEHFIGKIYSLEIFNSSGTTLANFVPCINPSNIVGMYDLVSNAFYGNAGTGTFIAGNPV